MNEGKISKRYARALLSYAVDLKLEDAVYNDIKRLAATFKEEPKFKIVLNNPMSRPKSKLKLLNAAFDNEPNLIISRFLDLVLKNKRETHLQTIALSYIDLYCQYKNIIDATLITAMPASEAMISKMKVLSQKIKTGTLSLKPIVDPDIKGGFILYIDTYRVDASVSSQLNRIRLKFKNENSRII